MRLVIIIFFLIASCTPNKQEEPEMENREGQKINLLYISSRGDGFDIYKNDLNGDEVKLTTNPGWDWAPLAVPGKNVILYNTQDTAGNFSLSMMNIEGQKVGLNSFGLEEWWLSPDGSKALFSRSTDNYTWIMLASADNPTDSSAITPKDSYNGRYKWSSDSKKIAFLSDRSGSNEIYIYSLSEGGTAQITTNNLREKYMSWSPDGSQLATTMSSGNDPNDIFIIDLESGLTNRLTNTPINESEISWSPDGKYIAYHAKVDDKDDIFIIEVSTGVVTKVTNGEGYHGEPEWFVAK